MPKKLMGWFGLFLVIAYCGSFGLVTAYAMESNSYKVIEDSTDSDSQVDAASTTYQSSGATGALVVGETKSSGFQLQTGTVTTNDPALSFSIVSGDINFGSFTPSNATVATATFSIINYTSYGYVVQIVGTPPTNGSHTISAMTSTAASQKGIEQFGINLVANTLPTSVGANPDNGQFGFGLAATDYGTSNFYRYNSGETIASAPKSSGITIYTITYLINVNSITPGGEYTSDQTLIITGTY